MYKNTASQKLRVFAYDSTTNLPKSGDSANITAYVSKDYGAVTVLTDTSATEEDATNAKGFYLFDLTQAETNADTLGFSAKSATANIVVVAVPAVVYTRPPNFSATSIDASGLLRLSATGVDDIWDESLTAHQTAGTAGRNLTLAGAIIAETTATGTPTTTEVILAAGSSVDDFYNEMIIIPVSGSQAGQARVILDYVGATKTITIGEAWTGAPSNGDAILIQATHVHTIAEIQNGLATAAALTTVDTVVDAIKAKTDSLTFTVAGQVDANVQYVNDVQVNGTGANGDEWGP